VAGEAFAHRLLSLHNLRFLIRLAERSRRHVREGTFESWSREWLERYRGKGG
jgi:queuine tRNA-ribosyltransferase